MLIGAICGSTSFLPVEMGRSSTTGQASTNPILIAYDDRLSALVCPTHLTIERAHIGHPKVYCPLSLTNVFNFNTKLHALSLPKIHITGTVPMIENLKSYSRRTTAP